MVRFLILLLLLAVLLGGAAFRLGAAHQRLTVEQRRVTANLLVDFLQLLDAVADVPISIDEVAAIERSRKKAIVWVDARPDVERDFAWIPGARRSDGFSADLIDPEKHLVIVYDTNGSTAFEKAKALNASKGWHATVRILKGGTLSWAYAGRYFQNQKGYVRALRVPSALWNLAPDDYNVVWE